MVRSPFYRSFPQREWGGGAAPFGLAGRGCMDRPVGDRGLTEVLNIEMEKALWPTSIRS
jgi:hypothetical protein